MTTFSYRAVNDDNKEVQGSIEAADKDTAMSAVRDMHLEPIEVLEAMRLRKAETVPADDAGMITYTFEAKDQSGMIHKGSMQAPGKGNAFKKLRDQGLEATILVPVGTDPAANDAELAQLKNATTIVPTAEAAPAFRVLPERESPLTAAVDTVAAEPKKAASSARNYFSLFDTLRLYAGWLLTWYGLFVALGYYSSVRALPFDIPGAQGFFYSPLIFSFIIAIYLYLMLHTAKRALNGEIIIGTTLTIIGIALFFVLRVNLI